MNKNYGNDKAFIAKHHEIIELTSDNTRVLVSPTLQGRVVTSTTDGENGYSFGWINYALIESGKLLPQCNNFGGEDRFWVGPEGGQFSVFFPQGSDFSFPDWKAPAAIDSEAWDVNSHSESSVTLSKTTQLTNTSGYTLSVLLDRTIHLHSRSEIEKILGVSIAPEMECVAFSSTNRLTNVGDFSWNKNTGMLSIWCLGQFIPSDDNTIIIPYKNAEGAKINDSYFGKIAAERLQNENNTLHFKGDGLMRGKIGTPPEMTIPIAFALDKVNQSLTIVKFDFDPTNTDYVNSMWEQQNEPFKGDVINSYNDGPLEDGTIMGGFYEIETSSAAANLAPCQTKTHRHTTIHMKGDVASLENIMQNISERMRD